MAGYEVWVYLTIPIGEPYNRFDCQIETFAKLFGGVQTGSGYGITVRDISFKFSTIMATENFTAALLVQLDKLVVCKFSQIYVENRFGK